MSLLCLLSSQLARGVQGLVGSSHSQRVRGKLDDMSGSDGSGGGGGGCTSVGGVELLLLMMLVYRSVLRGRRGARGTQIQAVEQANCCCCGGGGGGGGAAGREIGRQRGKG